MENEQYYLFVDKTGHCFEDFQTSTRTEPQDEIDKIVGKALGGTSDNGERYYRDRVGAMMRGGCKFIVGDMLAFRDDLTQAGFRWGVDFFVRKVDK